MKTILIVFSFQLFFILMLASTFNQDVKVGINDWANMTAKQFNHR